MVYLFFFCLLCFKLKFSNAIFFISLGMYFSKENIDFIKLARNNKLTINLLFILFFSLVYNDISIFVIDYLYLLIGSFALFSIISSLPNKLFSLFYYLSKYSFFIYAIHATYIYRIDKIIFGLTPNNIIFHLTSNILVALLACVIGIILYKTLNLVSPKALSILCGNRNQ